MNYAETVAFVQRHFTDGLAIVIGSGLSAAEGIPGMGPLADHLSNSTGDLPAGSNNWWNAVASALHGGAGLEAALLKNPPTEDQEQWITEKTVALLLPHEQKVISQAIAGAKELRLTTFLRKLQVPASGLPIVTTNYDRLVEVACELAGYHVDTTAVGLYAGHFDAERSCMASCRGLTRRGKTTGLAHWPRAIVLKPHGSLDWYRGASGPRRCSLELTGDRLIITPGLNKFRAGYNEPFDKHRELANEHIKRAVRFLIVGYGFNDDHLQVHLTRRIRAGAPTLILTRTPTLQTETIAKAAPACVCLSSPTVATGVRVTTAKGAVEFAGKNVWQLDHLTEEMLS